MWKTFAIMLGCLVIPMASGCRSQTVGGTAALSAFAGGDHLRVEVLSERPARSHADLGVVVASHFEPIDSVNNLVTAQWVALSTHGVDGAAGSAKKGQVAWTFDRLAPVPWHDRVTAATLQDALRAKAAERGANAVVLWRSGFDHDGHLWIAGIAIRR